MIHTLVFFVLALGILYKLGFWSIINQPGDPNATTPPSDNVALGVDRLQNEFGDRLPKEIYRAFEIAVNYHLDKMYSYAYAAYQQLRAIPTGDNQFYDLLQHSKVFRHNWDLLRQEMAKTGL